MRIPRPRSLSVVFVATALLVTSAAATVSAREDAVRGDGEPGGRQLTSAADLDHRIDWNDEGQVTRIGRIKRPDLRAYSGRTLRRILGRPSSSFRTSANSCRYKWRKHSLWATLADYGGRYTPCSRNYLQLAEIRGKGGSRWQTEEGLSFGDTLDRLREVYPAAREDDVYGESVWVIAELTTGLGEASAVPSVWAKIKDGRVVKFGNWVGGAGD